MSEQNYTLWANSNFIIAQCRDCGIPGYLIISLVPQATSLGELDSSLAAQLGLLLTQVAFVVEEIIQPTRLYCAQFGEETLQLHFHIFPRTQAVAQVYLREYPEQRDLIHGPVLLDWARTRYKERHLSEQEWEQIERIRTRLHDVIVEPG